jgi:hypothetical protein
VPGQRSEGWHTASEFGRWAGIAANAGIELALLMVLLGVPFCVYCAFRLRTARSSARCLLIDVAAAVSLYIAAIFLLRPPS